MHPKIDSNAYVDDRISQYAESNDVIFYNNMTSDLNRFVSNMEGKYLNYGS